MAVCNESVYCKLTGIERDSAPRFHRHTRLLFAGRSPGTAAAPRPAPRRPVLLGPVGTPAAPGDAGHCRDREEGGKVGSLISISAVNQLHPLLKSTAIRWLHIDNPRQLRETDKQTDNIHKALPLRRHRCLS